MKNALISVIIPVYNVERYLNGCFRNLDKQSYTNLEILLIDDGSTDKSGQLCDEYASRNSSVKVIHQNNHGAASARNSGIRLSTGDYIVFIDSDDRVANDYIECLYKTLLRYHAQISICGYQKFYKDNDIREDKEIKSSVLFGSEEALELLLYRRTLTAAPWGKIFKRNILVNNQFPEGKLFEDLGVIYKWFSAAEKIAYNPQIKYFYKMRSDSSMHSEFNIKKWDLIDISYNILGFVKRKYPNLEKAALNRLFISSLQILRDIPSKQYKNEFLELKRNIVKTRAIILFDKKTKKSSKILALSSYLNIYVLKVLGNTYDRIINGLEIKLKY